MEQRFNCIGPWMDLSDLWGGLSHFPFNKGPFVTDIFLVLMGGGRVTDW